MASQPLVSIIIPTYNRAHLIGETLDSVLAQTYTNWECIIVDDGSTDNTDEVIGEYVKKDSRFKYVFRPDTYKPGGNGARNYGFEISNGCFVNWFDDDDVMYVDFIQKKMAPFLVDEQVDVVFSAYTYFDIKGVEKRVSNLEFSGNILKDKLENKINFSTLSFLIKKRILHNHFFDETIRKCQDVDFFFRLFSKDSKMNIHHISTPLYKVRKKHRQISTIVSKSGVELKSKYIVYERMLEFYKKNDDAIGEQINKKIIQLQLKLLLENKNYFYVINRLMEHNYFTFKEKRILLFYSLLYILTGKGISKFKSTY